MPRMSARRWRRRRGRPSEAQRIRRGSGRKGLAGPGWILASGGRLLKQSLGGCATPAQIGPEGGEKGEGALYRRFKCEPAIKHRPGKTASRQTLTDDLKRRVLPAEPSDANRAVERERIAGCRTEAGFSRNWNGASSSQKSPEHRSGRPRALQLHLRPDLTESAWGSPGSRRHSRHLEKSAADCRCDCGGQALDMQFLKRPAEIVVHRV